jgi:TAT (twin-arginine translocation) pathway signal sequence
MEIYGISRRRFLQVAGATMMGAAVAGCVSGEQENQPTAAPEVPAPSTTFTEPTRKLSGDLKILMWSHFVPAHDKWFDPWAQDWGKKVGVNVTVDHIDQA